MKLESVKEPMPVLMLRKFLHMKANEPKDDSRMKNVGDGDGVGIYV